MTKITQRNVLYEDNHVLAVNKPAGLATMGVAEGELSLLNIAKDYIKEQYNKPGNVYLGIISRLDAPVTGVVLIARTSKAAARLTEQFKSRAVKKTYWAIAEGELDETNGQLEHYLRKDERHRKVHVTNASANDAQLARLTYRAVQPVGSNTLVEVQLETGRKHQIRVQFAKIGHSILGDRKYGSLESFPHGIALHSRRIVFQHPTQERTIEVVAPLPRYWPEVE